MERIRGIFWAALSSSTFGLAPLFTLLLLGAGYSAFETLTYRWGVASLGLGLCALLAGCRFRLSGRDFRAVFVLSLFRAATSFSLIVAYRNMASGAASTIHFMYPLAVALAMCALFGERRSASTFAAIALSIVGAVLLSQGSDGFVCGNRTTGMAAAVLSVFFYAAYIIGVRRSRAARIDSTVLTVYVMALGAVFFFAGGLLTGGVRLETDPRRWLWILGLALPATALSNVALVRAIRHIGPTLTSVFGALEPLTAVVIGILVFAEPFTVRSAAGVLLIVAAVLLVVLRNRPQGT